jgi:large subunit ribosomal protein L18e
MTITKTKVKFRVARKTNPAVSETIRLAVKDKSWFPLAQRLSGPTRSFSDYNLSAISMVKEVKDGSIVVVPGKVLGQGQITKKIQISALSFSASAEEKLKKAGVLTSTLLEQVKKNPKATGVILLP